MAAYHSASGARLGSRACRLWTSTNGGASTGPPDIAFVGPAMRNGRGTRSVPGYDWCLVRRFVSTTDRAGPGRSQSSRHQLDGFLPVSPGCARMKPEIVDNLTTDITRALHEDRTVSCCRHATTPFNLVALEAWGWSSAAVDQMCQTAPESRNGCARCGTSLAAVEVGCARRALQRRRTCETTTAAAANCEALARRPKRADMSTFRPFMTYGAEIDCGASQTRAEMRPG